MATELAKAYVQIIPSAQGIQGKIASAIGGEASNAGNQAGNLIGKNLVSTLKTALVSLGIGTVLKEAFSEGANLQQSLGGVETLFKENADTVKQYAAEAYKTAGLSANEYMESVTGFSASLLQSLGGDTAKAAEVANMALIDMSDNANKMGTSMESIQNAYQGFAKQNYTMLDNLKLGYGGTKEEMQRLLADAEKLSGVDYSIDNLNDVYEAIHVIQEDMGILGTTAKEGASTFSGALASMKASASNLLGNLTLGKDISKDLWNLSETFFTFFKGNLMPMFKNILLSLPDVIDQAFSIFIRSINLITNNADEIVEFGINLVTELADTIVYNIPYLIEAAWRLVSEFGRALIETDWTEVATNLLSEFQGSLELNAGEILDAEGSFITALTEQIKENLPIILERGIEIVTSIANGILEGIPELVAMAGEMISQFTAYFMECLPYIMQAGMDLVLNLANGIVQNLPAIIESVIQIIAQFVETVATNLPQILESGIEIIAELAAGIIEAIPKVIAVIPEVFQNIKNEFGNKDWLSIGSNIIEGIKNGILNGLEKIKEAAKNVAKGALDAAKSALGIHSPSREFFKIGEFVTMGFAQGIDNGAKTVADSLDKISQDSVRQFEADVAIRGNLSGNASASENNMSTRLDILIALLYQYLPECAKPTTIDGDSIIETLNRELGMAVI